MSSKADSVAYERQATTMERLFNRSPFSVVTMVARIKGEVTEEALSDAVVKVQRRHTNLRVRIEDDDEHNPRFTTLGVSAIRIEVVPRESADYWIEVVRDVAKIPFDFEIRPAIRFVLVQSPDVSELAVVCHHILCDGMSLAYLVRDLLEHLGDPAREVSVLPDPSPVGPDTMPSGLSLNPVVRYFIRRMNRKWEAAPVFFDQHDYESLAAAYWLTYDHQLLTIELSVAETTELVERCRKEHVTVNTALTAAFAAAQAVVLDEDRYEPELGVAADLRDRLQPPVGEVMGFYAGIATDRYEHNPKVGFWDNARELHASLQGRFDDASLFKDPLTWGFLSPSIIDAINFKKLGKLVPEDGSGSGKLNDFSRRKDVVLGILKRDNLDSPDRVVMGTAMTNLGRLDFATTYGHLELERLIMKPGGAFPLANVNMVVGAVTAAGRLSLTVEHVMSNIDTEAMAAITESSLGYLLAGDELNHQRDA